MLRKWELWVRAIMKGSEFLGDAVLGSSIANFLFKKFPLKDEGFLTKIRSRIVSRQHLNQISLKLGLPSFSGKKEN